MNGDPGQPSSSGSFRCSSCGCYGTIRAFVPSVWDMNDEGEFTFEHILGDVAMFECQGCGAAVQSEVGVAISLDLSLERRFPGKTL